MSLCTYQDLGDVALFVHFGDHDEGGLLLSVLIHAASLKTNKENETTNSTTGQSQTRFKKSED